MTDKIVAGSRPGGQSIKKARINHHAISDGPSRQGKHEQSSFVELFVVIILGCIVPIHINCEQSFVNASLIVIFQTDIIVYKQYSTVSTTLESRDQA